MAIVQLATSTDVAASIGRALTALETARVGAILDKASELFRDRSGQRFAPGTSTVRLKVNAGRVYLPQHPVVAVTTVTDDDGTAVEYTLLDQWLTLERRSDQFVNVSYSHGGTVPELVRLTIADIARKVLTIDPSAATGMSQHSRTTGPFTEYAMYATWAIGGQTMLAPDDNAIADTFKVRVPNVIVSIP